MWTKKKKKGSILKKKFRPLKPPLFAGMSGNFKFVMDYNDTEDEIEWERERLQSNRKKHRRRKRSKITDTDDVPVMKHVITDPAAFIDGVFTSTAFDEKLAAAGLSDSLCAVQLVRVRVGMAGEMASPEDIEIVDKVIAEVSERLNTLRALAVRVDVLELPDAFDLTSVLDGSVAPASLLTDICVVVVASEEVDVTWRTKLAAHAVCALDDETIELLKQDLAVAESQQLAPVFGLSETHRLAWLVGVDEFVVCLAKLDATLSDHGLTAPFSRRLQCVRNKLAGGRQKLGMAVNKWLTNVTDVGELLREYNLDMDIGTEKAEIARCIIAIEATRVVAEEHINQLVCDEIERRATVNSVLQAYHHPELYDSIVATCWHLPAAELSDFVLRSIARHRADMFRAIAHDDDVVVRSWDNREIKSNIIATFCERLADSGSLCSDGRSPENVINEAVAVARAEIEQWKAGIEQEQAMCVARKAELDRLLVSRGYVFQKEEEKSVGSRKMLCDTLYADVDKLENRGIDLAPDCLWRAEMSNGPNSCAPLRLPPRLAGVDVVALAQVVNDTSAPVRLPVRIEVQAARRSALLAALRSRGVPENRIRPVARGSDGALFWFLKCDRWPRSRASTSSLVGDVVESMRGDVFAALPQLAISCICHFTLLTDLANLCVASDSFALGAAVWIHEERQWRFEVDFGHDGGYTDTDTYTLVDNTNDDIIESLRARHARAFGAKREFLNLEEAWELEDDDDSCPWAWEWEVATCKVDPWTHCRIAHQNSKTSRCSPETVSNTNTNRFQC